MAEQRISDASTLSGWRKSSYSGAAGGECVEVLDGYAPGVPVRDSKNLSGPAVIVPASPWTSFLEAVKHGQL
ncbi:DUF397 domain-containing protein [Streptomyces acidiscabies]|uniref:DUF397 domain-containing protein n=1 Tax=Streptomyces acidiscabies TaxID=42234 RepID=UPI00076ED43D|nr:DUF397 domain-containing protein [Streptomyces acidiscabies]GAQ54707.1 hypothetical protein a10_04522 [Streptomyces acidiscabies]GAV41790.1 hypothetical protein Saa2_04704 [Streptomyces acidiscabies]